MLVTGGRRYLWGSSGGVKLAASVESFSTILINRSIIPAKLHHIDDQRHRKPPDANFRCNRTKSDKINNLPYLSKFTPGAILAKVLLWEGVYFDKYGMSKTSYC